MRKLLFAAFVSAAVAAVADPYAAYYFPTGIQAGSRVRVVVGGQGIGSLQGGWISDGGVRIVKITNVPGFPRARGKGQNEWMYSWFYDVVAGTREKQDPPPECTNANSDWNMCSWWYAFHERDELELEIVGRDLFVPKNDLQASPALAQLTILDIEADATAKPGMRDIVLYDSSGLSVPHVFYVSKEPRIVEPFYVIPPQKRGMKPHPDPARPQPLPVVFDGQIWPGETDTHQLLLKKGTRLTCVLTGRELLPYLGDAVPGFFNPVMRLSDSKGKELAFADDFHYLPDPILSCVIPEDGTYNLEVHDNLYRGRSDFVYMVECFADKENGPSYVPQERAFACFPPPASHIPPKAGDGHDVRTGVIDFPGRVIRHDFKVSEPSSFTFDLFARRMGSPLDGLIKLYGPVKKGVSLSVTPLLMTWDDEDKFLAGSVPQALCDPRGSWTFHEPGDYCLTVTDRAGDGGDTFTYTLDIAPLEPSFEIYSEKSAMRLSSGDAKFKARIVRRNGFAGEVRFESNDDYDFGGAFMPEDTTAEFFLTVKKPFSGVRRAKFYATGEIAPGVVRRVRVTPADSVEQAFAYTHLLPAHAFFLYSPEN